MRMLKLLFIYIILIHSNYAYCEFFNNENKIDFNSYTVKPKVDILSKNKKYVAKKKSLKLVKNKENIKIKKFLISNLKKYF